MSVGGSAGGSDHVWIKLATAKEDAFAYLETGGLLVGQVAALACKEFPRWRLNAGQVRIHLVTVSGKKPSEEEVDAAWATGTKPLAVSAAVTSGAWLVAVPTTSSSSGGGGDVGVARSSISPRSIKSLESAHSMSREAEASVAFWTLAHAAFPGATLERVQRRLLDGERPISNRSFVARDFPAFEMGRAAFVAATLSAEKPPAPTQGIQEIDFSGDYTKASYGELEVDCLLKLPALVPSDWTRDPAALNPPIFIAPPNLQPLPVRPGPDVQVAEESAGSAATRSRFSLEYYPANSALYLVGEVYAPLGGENPLQRTVQKLLQAERTIQFLCAKEDKAVGDCVLGVVFMGPHIDQALASQLFRSLFYYKAVLPCLWALHKKKRLLGYHMRKPFQPAVEAFLNATAVAQLTQKVQQLERRWCSLM